MSPEKMGFGDRIAVCGFRLSPAPESVQPQDGADIMAPYTPKRGRRQELKWLFRNNMAKYGANQEPEAVILILFHKSVGLKTGWWQGLVVVLPSR